MIARETIAETRIVTVTVTANSRQKPADNAAHQQQRNKHRTSEKLMEMIVNPIWAAPSSAAWTAVFPILRSRSMFPIITMASSTTKPTAILRPISDRLSRSEAERVHQGNVPSRPAAQ